MEPTNSKTKILWITRTGMMIALLIAGQAASAPIGNQLITGSIVNFVLFSSAMIFGWKSGITVGILSPLFAAIFGIAPPFPIIIPFIAAGNAVQVIVWNIAVNKSNNIRRQFISVVLASVAKFAVLYGGIIMFVAPILLGLPPASPIYWAFSFPQLITALIGGTAALGLLRCLPANQYT